MRQFAAFFVSLAILALGNSFLSLKANELYVKGKVTDPYGQPVARAKINLFDKDNHETIMAKSDGDGKFEIMHPVCSMFSLVIIPPSKLKLTQAVLENIHGDETKHFIVKLKPGFELSGRLVDEDKGLKGIKVYVMPVSKSSDKNVGTDTINGGGYTETNGDGIFQLTVTPGDKIIEFTNSRYKHLAHHIAHHVSVTNDNKIADIIFPASK